MAVHVAEAANVHENVKPESRAGTKGAQSFVVLAAMAQTQLDNLSRRARPEGRRLDRESGDRGGGWRSKEVSPPARLQEFRCARPGQPGRLGDGHTGKQFPGGLRQLRAGLDFVVVGLSVFDQRWSGADLAGKELSCFGGKGRVGGGNSCRKGSGGLAR